METNTQINENSKPKYNRKLLSISVLLIIIFGGLAWYFLYFIKTPSYSLNLIKDSVERHDVAKFNKHVDLDSVLSRGYDDLMAVMIETDKSITPEAMTFVNGFVKMFKSPVVSGLKDGLTRFVETGNWEDNQEADVAKGNQPKIDPNKLTDKSGLKNSSFKGVAYTKKDGKIATVGLKIFDKEANQEFILDVKMRELDDGTWQLAEISNFKEYILAIEKVKNEQIKKYIEDTQPIIDKYNNQGKESSEKINSIIVSSNLADANTKKQLKEIIENELLTNWNDRLTELNKLTVPEAAKELHNLRQKVAELRIQQLQKNIEWLNNESPQTMQEINSLRNQADNTNLQIDNLINKAKN